MAGVGQESDQDSLGVGEDEELMNLREEVDRLRRQIQSTIIRGGAAPRNDPGGDRVIYVPSERKLRSLSGHPKTDKDLSVSEWIEEAENLFRARFMTPQQKADFIYTHLEGNAREEIKYQGPAVRNDPQAIFNVLLKVFGETGDSVSLNQLQKSFFSRQQNSNETLREYSYALLKIVDKIILKSPIVSRDRNAMLISQFSENVKDSMLRRELKRRIRESPELDFFELREDAIRWSEDDTPKAKPKFRSYEVEAETKAQLYSPPTLDPNITELVSVVKTQQKQIDDLLATMKTLHDEQTQRRRQSFTCYNCHKPGHYARNCSAPKSKPSTAKSEQVIDVPKKSENFTSPSL